MMCLCPGSSLASHYYFVRDFVIPLPPPWPAWVNPNQSSVQSCSCTYLLTQLNKMLSIIGQRYPVNKVVVGEVSEADPHFLIFVLCCKPIYTKQWSFWSILYPLCVPKPQSHDSSGRICTYLQPLKPRVVAGTPDDGSPGNPRLPKPAPAISGDGQGPHGCNGHRQKEPARSDN